MGALIIALALLSQVPVSAQEEVARAKERIVKARDNLRAAVAKIEKKRPSDADFTAARAALDPLKSALDAGNDLEAQDLPYAKLALQARKELRSQRDRIDQRRLEIKLEMSREEIEKALADFEGALTRIEGKDAEDDQYERARHAADEVTKALDRGHSLVGMDPKYTTWVEQVTKQVETKRRSIDARQIGKAVEARRAKIEAARKALATAMAPVSAKEVQEAQLVQADAAVAALAKQLAEGKSLEPKQKDYAAFASSIAKQIEAAKQQIDSKRTDLASGKHQAEIDSMRATLDEAVKALSARNPSDELFIEAEKAADILKRMLDAAAALPSKSRSFAQHLIQARQSLKASQVEIAKRKLAVQLPRQKRKVEDARDELAQALAALRGDSADDKAFAAAEVSATKVDQVLQEGTTLAAVDRQYATYAREVKKRIEEARERIVLRRDELAIGKKRAEIAGARTALSTAFKELIEGNPGDSEFTSARNAAFALEKALGSARPLEEKDRKFAAWVQDMKKTLETTRGAIDDRELMVDVGIQRDKVERELAALEGALSALEISPSDAAFKTASDAAARVQSAIDSGAQLEEKAPRYASWAVQARKTIQRAGQVIQARRLETDVAGQTANHEKMISDARAAIETAKGERATEQSIEQAAAAIKAITDALAKSAALEKRDKSYAKFAASAKEQLGQMQQELEQAEHMLAFRKGPVRALAEGLTHAASAEGGGLEAQQKAYTQAVARFRACQDQSASLLTEHPKLAAVEFTVGQARSPGKNVIATCAAQADSAEESLVHVTAILAVYEGPAKSWEMAKAILAKAGSKPEKSALAEALGHFESCLEKGKILSYKHPKLAEMEFDVAGRKVKLSAVVADCQESAKTLRTDINRTKS